MPRYKFKNCQDILDRNNISEQYIWYKSKIEYIRERNMGECSPKDKNIMGSKQKIKKKYTASK